jgi:hypothetical protein
VYYVAVNVLEVHTVRPLLLVSRSEMGVSDWLAYISSAELDLEILCSVGRKLTET